MHYMTSVRQQHELLKDRKSMPAPLRSTFIVRRDIADSKRHSASSMLSPSWAFALPGASTVYRKYSDGGLTNDEDFLIEASTGDILAKAQKTGSGHHNLASIALYDHRDQRPMNQRTPRVIHISKPSVFQSKYTFEYEGMIYRWGYDANPLIPKRNRDLYCDVIEDSSMDMLSTRRSSETSSRLVARFIKSRNDQTGAELLDSEELGRFEVDFRMLERRPLLDPKGLEILLLMTLAMVEESVSEGLFKRRTSGESRPITEAAVVVSRSMSKKLFGGFADNKAKTVFV